MCGINGLLHTQDPGRVIRLMNDALSHRGPDAQGEWSDGLCTLGHRRLSIIDLSAEANQPFVKEGLVIVYNGEIYNFPQLRRELADQGVVFRTHSDTEVILELFRRYREGSFEKLTGMFAFAIYDIKERELFLVRDCFGIKPLFYTFLNNNMCAFSSELKALTRVPGLSKEINSRVLVACMNYLWPDTDESIFKGIYKVPPAHYMRVLLDQKTAKCVCYWQLKAQTLQASEKDIAEQLSVLIEKSIKRHLIADVPVGAFLSGGLDSSLICAIAHRHNTDLSTYTIAITPKDKRIEKMPEDYRYAKKVANLLGVKHTDIIVEPSAVDYLKEMAYSLDEPIGDPAAINTYLICKLARDHGIKVLLSGMGADELFGGYRRNYATLLAERINRWPSFTTRAIQGIAGALPVRIGSRGIRLARWAKRFSGVLQMPMDEAYMRSYSYYGRRELPSLFAQGYDQEISQLCKDHKRIFYAHGQYDFTNKMCYTDINMFMRGLNLTYTDRASMAASVEVRVPFIDKEIIEYAMSIPGKYKINNRIQKYILKEVAQKYIPKNIIYRPKASFGMPLRSWISRDLKEMVDDFLSVPAVKKRGLFNPQTVRSIIDNDRKGTEDNAYRIYQLLTVELWARRYLDT